METKFNLRGSIPKYILWEESWRSPDPNYFDMDNLDRADFAALKLPNVKTCYTLKKAKAPGKDITENVPIKLKMVGVDRTWSSRGGNHDRIFVETSTGKCVEVQLDVFFEALMRDGINHKTRELNSEFIFATVKNTTKLVRIGSEPHEACMERMKLAEQTTPIDFKTMSVGEVFQKKSGTRACFLGFVTSRYLKLQKGKLRYSTMKMGTLWIDIPDRVTEQAEIQKWFDDSLSDYILADSKIKGKSGHGFINRCENLKIKVPTEIVNMVRFKNIKTIKNELTKMCGKNLELFERYVKGKRVMTTYQAAGKKWNQEWYVPPWYQIQAWINDTKLTNMTVWGMESHPNEVSKQIERVLELYNTKTPPRSSLW